MKKKKAAEFADHEDHQQEGGNRGFCQEAGNLASEVPTADREATDAEDMMFNLSLGSQDNPARMSMSTKAKGKAKASINPRAGHTLNHAQPTIIEDADGGLKGRDKLSRKRGSATKVNGSIRPETRRIRSGDGLRRVRSEKTVRLLRDRQSGTKKRQETEQTAQGAASTGTDLGSRQGQPSKSSQT